MAAVVHMTEAELTAAVLELLDVLGWRAMHTRAARTSHGWSTPVQGPTAQGWPDIVAVRGDRIVFAELKARRGKLFAAQEEWIAALSAVGETYVWRPDSWLDGTIEAVLKDRP
jgi:hypothetical protein